MTINLFSWWYISVSLFTHESLFRSMGSLLLADQQGVHKGSYQQHALSPLERGELWQTLTGDVILLDLKLSVRFRGKGIYYSNNRWWIKYVRVYVTLFAGIWFPLPPPPPPPPLSQHTITLQMDSASHVLQRWLDQLDQLDQADCEGLIFRS